MTRTGIVLIRLAPVVLLCAAAGAYIAHIEGSDGYLYRNFVPLLLIVILAARTLVLGKGTWTGAGWRWPLGTAGFAIPAAGLSLYLHWGYSADLNGMYSQSVYPMEVFRYLPFYTLFAGAIGFTIGWIAGRNV